jgi:peptidoglycan hydrolase-like protein with peptidoglycan-binding domain
MSFAATKKRHGIRYSVSSSKKGRRSKAVQQTHRNYQATPSPERYKEIQQVLSDKGYFKGDVNGQWGPNSVDALRRFQSDQNLDPDGKLGSLSLIALGLGPKRITAQQAKPEQQQQQP